MKKTTVKCKGMIALLLALAAVLSLAACSSPVNTASAGINGTGDIRTPDTSHMNTTSYGTVDWSTAAQGYISFTAAGQERVFILQSPDGTQDCFAAADGESIKLDLTDGAGKYQYAICEFTEDRSACYVNYKNSFNVSKTDSDLVRPEI